MHLFLLPTEASKSQINDSKFSTKTKTMTMPFQNLLLLFKTFQFFLMFPTSMGDIRFYKFHNNKPRSLKVQNLASNLVLGAFLWWKKYPIVSVTRFFLECGFGIGYGISQKYRAIWVSVLVLDINQISGFGRTLH